MTENMKKLLELASEDKKFAKEIREADKEALIRLAKAHEIELSEEDFEKSQNELSDDELDAVAGGGINCVCVSCGGGDGCACVIGGGGKDGGLTSCACAVYGEGYSDKVLYF